MQEYAITPSILNFLGIWKDVARTQRSTVLREPPGLAGAVIFFYFFFEQLSIQGGRPVVYRTTFSIFSGWLRLHFD